MHSEAELVEEVRERLARDSGEVTPHRVAEALRASGRPVGDATVLAVHEALRRDVVGAGPLEPLLRMPEGRTPAGSFRTRWSLAPRLPASPGWP